LQDSRFNAQLGLSAAVVSLARNFTPIASATQLLNRENIAYIVYQGTAEHKLLSSLTKKISNPPPPQKNNPKCPCIHSSVMLSGCT